MEKKAIKDEGDDAEKCRFIEALIKVCFAVLCRFTEALVRVYCAVQCCAPLLRPSSRLTV